MLTLNFTFVKETKNYALYAELDAGFNKLYLPKGLAHTLVVTISGGEPSGQVCEDIYATE